MLTEQKATQMPTPIIKKERTARQLLAHIAIKTGPARETDHFGIMR